MPSQMYIFDAYFLLFLIINWKCNLNTLKFFETENMRIIFINVFFFLFTLHTYKKNCIFSSSSSWVERDVVLFSWKKCNLFAYIFFLQSNISFISKIYLQRQDCCCVVVFVVVCWYFCFLLFFSYIFTMPLYYVRMQFWLCCVVTALTASSKIHGTNWR